LLPGTKIYRIIDAGADSNGGYWAFDVPSSKSEWRSGYAVLEDWNKNGAYVEYVIPEGGLNAWLGKTASQTLETTPGWIQPGGLDQIFVPDSRALIPSDLSRTPTLWGGK